MATLLRPQDELTIVLRDKLTCTAHSLKNAEMAQWINILHKEMIFLKNGRKFACRNHNERFDYVTSHKIKYNYEIMFQSNVFS